MNHFKTATAKTVFERTYSREKPNGERETWPETVQRVTDGNLAFVDTKFHEAGEREKLMDLIQNFKIIPAGRHLKSTGVNDFANNNCWAAGWIPERPAEHFTFTLLRLAEGGGVGTNYSNHHLAGFPEILNEPEVHIVCDPEHADYLDMVEAGLISTQYAHTWAGAYPVEDSRGGWANALDDLITNAHDYVNKHKERVYDVSRVRPKGSPLRQFGGCASGPVPFAAMMRNVGSILARKTGTRLTGMDAMDIDHEIAQCIVSGGVRRSARMAIMAWDDPQIWEFLDCKEDPSKHWTTNCSVEIDDRFTSTVNKMDATHQQELLRRLAEGARLNGEPGIWNSSLSAQGEPDGAFCTNPCGEITLRPWEPCCLGHVNLAAFVDKAGVVDRAGLLEAHRLMTRFLIRATHARVADPKSQRIIEKNRRIGVGHLGVADFLAKQGILYSEAPNYSSFIGLLSQMQRVVKESAVEFCHWLRVPTPVKMTTIAPTGSISKLASVSGEGIHAPFGKYFIRRIRFSNIEPGEVAQIEEYKTKGYSTEPCIYAPNTTVVEIPTKDPLVNDVMDESYIQTADELSLDEMLAMQELYQRVWADNAVSYTANIDADEYTNEAVEEALKAFMTTLKGTTVFPEVSRPQSPYERIGKDEYLKRAAEIGIENTDSGFDEECATGACPL